MTGTNGERAERVEQVTDGDGTVVDSAVVGEGLELSYPTSDGAVVE